MKRDKKGRFAGKDDDNRGYQFTICWHNFISAKNLYPFGYKFYKSGYKIFKYPDFIRNLSKKIYPPKFYIRPDINFMTIHGYIF